MDHAVRATAPCGRAPGEEILHDQPHFERAIDALLADDARIAGVLAVSGRPTLRRGTAGFAGLAGMVVAQQVSAIAARAITARLTATLGGSITVRGVLEGGPDKLREGGLSGPKIRSMLGIARMLDEGTVDLDAVALMPSDAARDELIRLPGIGAWTADVYLLFALGRADAFPEGDLALQVAAGEAFDLPGRCHALGLAAIAEDWRPRRGVAAQLLWAYYSVKRAGLGTPA